MLSCFPKGSYIPLHIVVPALIAQLPPRLLLEDHGVENEYRTVETCQKTGVVIDISDGWLRLNWKPKWESLKIYCFTLIMGTFSLHIAHQDFHKNEFKRELFSLMAVRIKMRKPPKKGEIQETALYFLHENCPSRTFFFLTCNLKFMF